MPLLDDTDRVAEIVDAVDRQGAGTFGQIDGEEVGPAFLAGAPIVHGSSSSLRVGVRKLTPTDDHQL